VSKTAAGVDGPNVGRPQLSGRPQSQADGSEREAKQLGAKMWLFTRLSAASNLRPNIHSCSVYLLRGTGFGTMTTSVIGSDSLFVFESRLKHSYFVSPITSTHSASEVTTLWRFANIFIIMIIITNRCTLPRTSQTLNLTITRTLTLLANSAQ